MGPGFDVIWLVHVHWEVLRWRRPDPREIRCNSDTREIWERRDEIGKEVDELGGDFRFHYSVHWFSGYNACWYVMYTLASQVHTH